MLTVRFMDRYVLSDGAVEQAAGDPPVVWTRGDGRYTSSQGQAAGPGVRVYENMPSEPLLICWEGQCLSTCQRDVNLGRRYFGRPFPGWNLHWQEGQIKKGVELTLTQLEPWKSYAPAAAEYDWMRITVPNVRFLSPYGAFVTEGETTGRAFLRSVPPNMPTLIMIPSISATAGDAIFVQQQRSHLLEVTGEDGAPTTFTYWTGVRAGEVRHYPDFYSPVELALQAPPAASVSFRIDEPRVAPLISMMGMNLRQPTLRSEVFAARREGAAMALDSTLPLLTAIGSRWSALGTLTFAYGSTSDEPVRVLEVRASARAEDSHLYSPEVGWRRELVEGVSQVLRPEVSQVDDLRISKLPGEDLQVSWSPPAFGVAHQYELLLFSDFNKNRIPRRLLRVVTTEPGAVIPALWVPWGETSFRFIVRSVHLSGANPGEFSLDETALGSWADRLSGWVPR
ncbi:MAG TPA: hypothetical protein VK539_38255 [Myxococcaceae bacterium]|nr:hypothetical protein [Myxococcaceae bacterium]